MEGHAPPKGADIVISFTPDAVDLVTIESVVRLLHNRLPDVYMCVHSCTNTGNYVLYVTAAYATLLKCADNLGFTRLPPDSSFLSSQECQLILRTLLFEVVALKGDSAGRIAFTRGQPIVHKLISAKIIKSILPLHNREHLGLIRRNWVQKLSVSSLLSNVRKLKQHRPLDQLCGYFGIKVALYLGYLAYFTDAFVLPACLGITAFVVLFFGQCYSDFVSILVAIVISLWAVYHAKRWKSACRVMMTRWNASQYDVTLQMCRGFQGPPVRYYPTGRIRPDGTMDTRKWFRYCVSYPTMLFCLLAVIAILYGMLTLQDQLYERLDEPRFQEIWYSTGSMGYLNKILSHVLFVFVTIALTRGHAFLSYWLTEKENYKYLDNYESNLLFKIVPFQFLTSYVPLYYIAFYKQDFQRLQILLFVTLVCRTLLRRFLSWYNDTANIMHHIALSVHGDGATSCAEAHIAETLVTQSSRDACAIVRRLEGRNAEVDLGEKKTKSETENTEKDTNETEGLKEKSTDEVKKSEETNDKERIIGGVHLEKEASQMGTDLTQAEVEEMLPKCGRRLDEELDLLLNFGYAALFSAVCPLLGLALLVLNALHLHTTVRDLCLRQQRPFTQRLHCVTIWQSCLAFIGLAAVVTNCAFIGTSRLADWLLANLDTTQRILAIVIFEHLVLGLRLVILRAFGDTPQPNNVAGINRKQS